MPRRAAEKKNRPGRPARTTTPGTQQIVVRLSDDESASLQAYCEAHGERVSSVVRAGLRKLGALS